MYEHDDDNDRFTQPDAEYSDSSTFSSASSSLPADLSLPPLADPVDLLADPTDTNDLPSLAVPRPDVIPGLFPRRSLNLLVHLPFSGATRFLLPQLNHYASALPFLERPPATVPGPGGDPVPPDQLGMILCARDPRDMRYRLHQLGLDRLLAPGVLPIVKRAVAAPGISAASISSPSDPASSPPDTSLCDIHALYRALLDRQAADWRHLQATTPPAFLPPAPPPRPRFLIIESMHLLVPPGRLNDPHAVAEFSNQLKQFCEDRDCTILGTVPVSKTRGDVGYKRLSEKIYGTIQWATAASSLIFFEEVDSAPGYRRITLASKATCGPLEPLWASFGDYGRLNLCSRPERIVMARAARLSTLLEEEKPGAEFTRADFQAWGMREGLGARTVDRWLAGAIRDGMLIRTNTGPQAVFQKPTLV